jgi:hypothetical protein
LTSQHFDLFGDPIPENWGKRGRPQHVPTQENRNKVSMLLAFGWSNDRIAQALHVTPPTLRKHYLSQLRYRGEMRDRLDASLAMTLWRQVEAGNVSAMREFRALLDHNDLMLFGGRRPDPEPKPPKLGKKERALIAANTPPGQASEWGEDLTPKRH